MAKDKLSVIMVPKSITFLIFIHALILKEEIQVIMNPFLNAFRKNRNNKIKVYQQNQIKPRENTIPHTCQ